MTTPAGATTADVILNHGSGKLDKQALADRIATTLRSRGFNPRVTITRNGREIVAARDRAAAGDATIVIAGGGDGTIATVAERIAGSGKTLGVLPLGTFNYFARTLGIPLDLDEALQVIAAGTTRAVDVGEVNGNLFLNNSSIGLYPAVLETRESTYRRIGRSQVVAYLSTALTLLEPPRLVNLTITADGQLLARRTPLVFIGCNAEQMTSLGIVGAECIGRQKLALYVTRPLGTLAVARLAARLLFRRLRRAEDFEVICAGEVLIGLRRRRVRVALDGEVRVLATPLRYRLRPEALRVRVPPVAVGASADDSA